ncbi:UNVERIFIED_CONTAM: Glutamate--tRNA ligase, cytoplasmic [Sesamum latifolium]|uniref:Glutamate--tRNA ligase, cytoplasmic n=1 Tax=Sesamum latifolium TaxID=2727402 RepID=A0AAW2UXE5_9LAMI
MELNFAADSPPLHAIAAAKIAGVSLVTNPTLAAGSPPTLVLASGQRLHGGLVVLRYIGRIGSLPDFYGRDAYQSSQIDEWLEYAPIFGSGSEFEGACSFVDEYLLQNTFLVGNSLSIADVAVWVGLAVENGATETAGSRAFEVDLPHAEVGKVKLRFAPEPSGYLHIGHSKAALLNQYFADRYKGQVIVRFDDTNPDKESNEFVDNLLKDIETLGIKYSAVTYTSDYFPQLMEMAEKLIKEGKAYVDDTPREKMQHERMEGIESKCRNNSVEENLKLWRK